MSRVNCRISAVRKSIDGGAEKVRPCGGSGSRVQVEHIIREVKVFRILGERYRNRRCRFALRGNLIADIYNSELNKFFD